MPNTFDLTQIDFSGSVNLYQSRFYNIPDPVDGTEVASWNTIQSYLTSSQQDFATTGSNTFTGDQIIQGDVDIYGSTTTETLIFSSSVYHVTASWSSGSTIFGNAWYNTHQFTGSMFVSNSIDIDGQMIIGGRLTDKHEITGSLEINGEDLTTLSSSISARVETDEANLTDISSSIDSSITDLSSSLETRIYNDEANLTTISASIETRATNLETYSSSLDNYYLRNTDDAFNGSLEVTGSVDITGSLAVQDKITIDGKQKYGTSTGIWFGDGDTGLYEHIDNSLYFYTGGSTRWRMLGLTFGAPDTSGPVLQAIAATATTPNITLNKNDGNTGIGWAGADQLSLIAGGVEMARLSETAASESVSLITPDNEPTPHTNGAISFWLDEAGDNLKVSVKYSDGTTKTATVAFD